MNININKKNKIMSKSKIEWTSETLNVNSGCDQISTGCKNCYAKTMSKRLQAMGKEKYKDNFEVRMHPQELLKPYKWKKPRLVFLNSMSDLFHKEVPLDFIRKAFKMMNENPQHTFQILTKRANRLFAIHEELSWSENIWMGVSVEEKIVENRIDLLRKTNAKVKFLSLDTMIGDFLNLNLKNIDWVIVGGESGHARRPMELNWMIYNYQQCEKADVPFFIKRWG